MIALPHLIFLSVLWAAGFAAWLLDVGRWDAPTQVAGAVIAGLSAGIVVGAWC